MAGAIDRALVTAGDHSLPDPTKRGPAYHEEDEVTNATMIGAFTSRESCEFALEEMRAIAARQ